MTQEQQVFTVEELKEIPFPACVEYCGLANILGVSECENVPQCQYKFQESE